MWMRWATGDVWSIREGWEAATLPAARRSFASVMASRHLPRSVQAQVLERLEDSFFLFLCPLGDALPGWAVLATRVLETAGDAPTAPLVATVGATGRERLSRCAATRGVLARTLAGALGRPAPTPTSGRPGSTRCLSPRSVEGLLDLHVAQRLLDRWSAGASFRPREQRHVVLQGRSRARARMRAVAAELDRPGGGWTHSSSSRRSTRAPWPPWPAWPGPGPATSCASTSPCTWSGPSPRGAGQRSPASRRLDPDHHDVVTTWVLLVVLKGRLDHLLRWVDTGARATRTPPGAACSPGAAARPRRTGLRPQAHLPHAAASPGRRARRPPRGRAPHRGAGRRAGRAAGDPAGHPIPGVPLPRAADPVGRPA